jgi:GNAT superfamily N-acetyltransferase
MQAAPVLPSDIALRTELRPGELGVIVSRHGTLYAQEHGWDATFEAYVAGPLADFVRGKRPRERLWVAERADRLVGSIGIVTATPATAQLRWFLVDPECRGLGLGRRLLHEALRFSLDSGYMEIILWTERSLAGAARLYRDAGFRLVEEKPGRVWGAEVIEEQYRLVLPV